ncbi:3-ketoacyl-ACP reductase [Caballeronia arvi]|uniref:3-ketoacyl-ACP reductase n=1 Tax=Caballeronia arvi TaxID=1777135 RepID=A0A158KWF1_9BURK|nr:SDR family NAD(P)-dependent oxidoreductase [Caballeronia arvi]SAL85285.1 3-ketoacyl-ACP reductase [Caballeronia arvi]
MKLDFSGQVVAVTGAGSGFGRAIAAQFADLGARVYATDVSDAALSPLKGPNIETAVVNLLDRRASAQWVASIAESAGRLDVMVNNAGGVMGQAHKPLETVSDDEWDRVIDINLGSAFALARAVTPVMKAQKSGAIITISSGAALQASLTGVQAYCSAKHGVLGLTRQLAHELGPFGIRVNSVAPGFVRTNPATEAQWDAMGPDNQAALMRSIALGRLGTPQDIANVTVFLASPLASFVNGQIISVDGGK